MILKENFMNDFDLLKKRVGYCREFARKVLIKHYPTLSQEYLPIKLESIASKLGYEVVLLDEMDSNHSALVLRDKKLIGLNSKHHIHRRRFSLAHELGHIFLDHPPEEECEFEDIKVYNQEADEFASELLVPLSLFKKVVKEYGTNGLSNLFRVSRDVIIIKATKHGLISFLK